MKSLFHTVQIVRGSVIIRDNRSLRHLIGLRNLAKIGGSLVIQRNPQLATLPNNLLSLLPRSDSTAVTAASTAVQQPPPAVTAATASLGPVTGGVGGM